MMRPILKKFRATILKYRMLSEGDRVVLAVSGGIDSMAMLNLFGAVRDEFSLKLAVCHLNHGLRGKESERDFRFVKSAAQTLGLSFYGKRLKPGALKTTGGSVQEAARNARYEFFESVVKKCKAGKIALGHTLDDQAETVLMRLIKGASLSGLRGIPPVRFPFIRPLIEVGRDEIEEFVKGEGISFVLDSSNLTDKYLRNDIRLNLLPLLKKEYNPNIIETLGRTARVLGLDDEFIQTEAEKAFGAAVIRKGKDTIVFDRQRLLDMHEAIAARVFLKGTEGLPGHPEVYGVHIESFFEMLRSARPNASVDLPQGVRVIREYGKIILTAEKKRQQKGFRKKLNIKGMTEIPEAGIALKAAILKKIPHEFDKSGKEACFDYDALKGAGSLTIRQMEPGDIIIPFGMKGSKKVKDIFIDKKIPMEKRRGIPLLLAGKDIIWIAGIRQSGLYRVSEATKRVLKVALKKPGN